ncbi:hypothetical protein OG239_41830 (plasmid) [Streptomyces sp. NBC_00868]|uniref:tetratricopeptide repeat protein n=1 Tax=Streptomyces sp. NBC_00868 TaxID=2903683 RepID=UPI00386766A6|nr:hypothetical protein OG239_41830 [Streptomyces sp. NBC_00868]
MLADAVQSACDGRSQMVVLVGSSSTGKTRACWEAVQPLAGLGWRLWHPFDPTRAAAALEDLYRVGPKTVVWLNEAQHYLGDPHLGEEIAAAVHSLLTQPERAPVVVLATLWPEFHRRYTTVPKENEPDPHSRVRELVEGCSLSIPSAFDPAALQAARSLALSGDSLLADALTRSSEHGQVTQELAGAPALLHAYRNATPAAGAVLEAAIDARRLNMSLHLPQAFLTDAALDYLTDADYDQLNEDWSEAAFAELAEPVHGKQAPLRRASHRPARRPPATAPAFNRASAPTGPVFRLADYLEQHGRLKRRLLCPSASFWQSAYDHLASPQDLDQLAWAAYRRHRLQWAWALWEKAGTPSSLTLAASVLHRIGDLPGMRRLLEKAAKEASPPDLHRIMDLWEKTGNKAEAERIAHQATEAGDATAFTALAYFRENAGLSAEAEAFAFKAARAGDPAAVVALAEHRLIARDYSAAKRLVAQLAPTVRSAKLVSLWEEAGDYQLAERIAIQVAEAGDGDPLADLAGRLARKGEIERAECLLVLASDAGSRRGLMKLARLREAAGDISSAEEILTRAIQLGAAASDQLMELYENSGNREAASNLAITAAHSNNFHPLHSLALHRDKSGDHEGSTQVLTIAAGLGSAEAMLTLAKRFKESGEHDKEMEYLRKAATRGSNRAAYLLAQTLAKSGESLEATSLFLQIESKTTITNHIDIALWYEKDGMTEAAERMAQKAAAAGNLARVRSVARAHRHVGDTAAACRMLQLAADAGDPDALMELVALRCESGDTEEAKRVALRSNNWMAIHWVADTYTQNGEWTEALELLEPLAKSGDDYALREYVLLQERLGNSEVADIFLQYAKSGRGAFEALAATRRSAKDTQGTQQVVRLSCNAGLESHRIGSLYDMAFEYWPFGLDSDGSPTSPWHSHPQD